VGETTPKPNAQPSSIRNKFFTERFPQETLIKIGKYRTKEKKKAQLGRNALPFLMKMESEGIY
jgi:hypothetical protein